MINTNRIELNSLIVQVEGNIVSDMDGEKVMLSVSNGKYYNLGRIGGDIWDLINNPISIQQLVTELISQYDIGQDQCEEQVNTFIQNLLEEDLIHIVEKTKLGDSFKN
jgi:hypothetical protein